MVKERFCFNVCVRVRLRCFIRYHLMRGLMIIGRWRLLFSLWYHMSWNMNIRVHMCFGGQSAFEGDPKWGDITTKKKRIRNANYRRQGWLLMIIWLVIVFGIAKDYMGFGGVGAVDVVGIWGVDSGVMDEVGFWDLHVGWSKNGCSSRRSSSEEKPEQINR